MQQHSMLGSLHSACLCFTSAWSTLHGKTGNSRARQHCAIMA